MERAGSDMGIRLTDTSLEFCCSLSQPKTPEQKQRAERKLLERQDKKRKALKEAGYDYDFEGYGKAVTA